MDGAIHTPNTRLSTDLNTLRQITVAETSVRIDHNWHLSIINSIVASHHHHQHQKDADEVRRDFV